MTKTVYFNHKGQMINYYNKVTHNNQITYAICGYDCEKCSYYVMYSK